MGDSTESIPRFPLAWPSGWVRTIAQRRQRAGFSKKRPGEYSKQLSVADAVARLQGELDRLRAKNSTLSTNVELRLDGRPRSDNEPRDPGAAVYFSFKGRATVFACDHWNRVADNIAAIAAHIDAIRRIERYGVGSLEQALAGYKSLPADTAADWRAVFGFPKEAAPSLDELDKAYKRVAREKHPDVGGSDEEMSHVNRAHDFALTELS